MRKTLKNSAEVFHYWANKVQSEGQSGNVYFRDDKVYSYGSHFCIARHLPNNTVAFTTRGYSNSTAKHINHARNAARHLTVVLCNDPADTAHENMRHARMQIRDALNAAEKKGIRQTTRDKMKGQALSIAENANTYLAALPESERGTEVPIDTAGLEAVRATLIAAQEASERIRQEQHAARIADLRADLMRWKAGEIYVRTGLYELPPALRISGEVIQTSHGAEIPVSDALKLWPLILRTMRGQRDFEPGMPVGVYHLTAIRKDGSLRVGCHDISFEEVSDIANQLGLTAFKAE